MIYVNKNADHAHCYNPKMNHKNDSYITATKPDFAGHKTIKDEPTI